MRTPMGIFVFLLTIALTRPAGAITIPLTYSNALPNGAPYATVSYVDTGQGAVGFTISANPAVLNPGAQYGTDKFFFSTDLALLPSDISCDGCSITTNKTASAFGLFGYELASRGNKRRVDPFSFTVTYPGLTTADFVANIQGSLFSAHIAGFNFDETTSAYFAGEIVAIPEPATLLLMGTGLVLAAAWGRRRLDRSG